VQAGDVRAIRHTCELTGRPLSVKGRTHYAWTTFEWGGSAQAVLAHKRGCPGVT
jgi:hypothetical protein